MPVNVKIPTQLRAATGGEAVAAVEGSTVAEVLDALYERGHPLPRRSRNSGRRRRRDHDPACRRGRVLTAADRREAVSSVARVLTPYATRGRVGDLLPRLIRRRQALLSSA